MQLNYKSTAHTTTNGKFLMLTILLYMQHLQTKHQYSLLTLVM